MTERDLTAMTKRHLTIPHLIVNSPFAEPSTYWQYESVGWTFSQEPGRRPAGYIVATPGSNHREDPGKFIELELVNRIRPLVKAWRENGYPGATGISRRLLEHWHDREQRDRRFFFCQLEAIETLIWLSEAAERDRLGIEVPGDGGPFPRWCTKLATGTGKTIVMAMVVAWQVLNKVADRKDERYSKHMLVVAPGLTVKNRLAVLVPDAPGNYYDEFQIIPPGLQDQLRQGRVLVHNWHKLDWDTAEQIAKRKSVDKRGALSDEAWVRGVLGEMATARDLIVINDEAHHAWRVPAESKLAGVAKADIDEATKWVGALDRIHRARGVRRGFDFSATPFAPSGKKTAEEALFGWIVSDFGLNDAIEAGLVKTPRVVVRDDGKRSKDYKSRFYHLYNDPDVKDDLNRQAEPHAPLPNLVVNAYDLLGKDWLETRNAWREQGHATPPVMITVANRVETAERIERAFLRGSIHIEELCEAERLLRIDSKVLQQAESVDEPVSLVPAATADDDEADESDADSETKPVRKETKLQQAERIRREINTVGQAGQPGEQLQNVISVGMLSEGWDAKTVTHIMGLRAFSSQLLCEQVVGRGLRRTSYEVDPESGLFRAEYVNIFGVPFTFLPHEEKSDTPPPPPPPVRPVQALPEREAEFGISWPNIVRIEHVFSTRLSLDWPRVRPLELQADDVVLQAELAAMLSGRPDLKRVSEIDLEEMARRFRPQTQIFEAARDIFDQAKERWRGSKTQLLTQVIRLVEQFVASDKLKLNPASVANDETRRRLVLFIKSGTIVQHLWDAIRSDNAEQLIPIFDTQQPIRSTSDMRTWYTSRPCESTRHSHINIATFDSRWEATEAYQLDRKLAPLVQAWVKNEHLGFEVHYVFRGVVRKYRPDFLIRLTNGTTLILEVKGQKTEESEAKRAALDEWVRAVNAYGEFGHWANDVSFNTADLPEVLRKHSE